MNLSGFNFTGWHAVGLFAVAQVVVAFLSKKPDSYKLRKEMKIQARQELIHEQQEKILQSKKYDFDL